MHIQHKDIRSLNAAIDFMENNTDAAEDREYWDGLLGDLRDMLNRAKQSQHKRLVSYYLKKRKSGTNGK